MGSRDFGNRVFQGDMGISHGQDVGGRCIGSYIVFGRSNYRDSGGGLAVSGPIVAKRRA